MKIIPVFFMLVLVALLASGDHVLATPSSAFQEEGGEVADDWGIYRTRSFGNDGFYQLSESGFRPVIVFIRNRIHCNATTRLRCTVHINKTCIML